MNTNTIAGLGAKPAGQDQIARAREYAAGDTALLAEIDALLKENATRAQMVTLLDKLRVGYEDRKLNQAATVMCAALGNPSPTTLEKLLAIQIQALHEQTQLLTGLKNQMRNNAGAAAATDGAMNAILAGWIAGTVARI